MDAVTGLACTYTSNIKRLSGGTQFVRKQKTFREPGLSQYPLIRIMQYSKNTPCYDIIHSQMQFYLNLLYFFSLANNKKDTTICTGRERITG
jgi:hypothetical protein